MKTVIELIKIIINEHKGVSKILTLCLVAALIYMFYVTKDSEIYTKLTYIALSAASFSVLFGIDD